MFRRRDFVLTALAAVVAAPCAFAQSGFPGKPITMLVGAAPGGTTDLASRTTITCGADSTLATATRSLVSHCGAPLTRCGEIT